MTWIAPKRSVDPGARRRQTREVLIYNREDLNRALTESYKNPARISVLKLAADIVLTSSLQINQCNVTIDGGNLYGFTASSLLYTITSYADLTLVNLRNNNVKFKILNLPFKIDNCVFSTDAVDLAGPLAIDISVDNTVTTIRPILISNTTIHNFIIPIYVQPVAGSEFIHMSAEDITISTDVAADVTIYTRCSATIYNLKYLNLLNPVPDSRLTISATRRLTLANSLISELFLNQVTCTNSLVCNNRFVDGIGTASYGSFTGSNFNRFVNNSGVITKTFAANDLDLDSSLPNSSGNQINVDASAAPAAGYVLTATSATTAVWQPGGGGTFGTLNVTFSRSIHSVTTTVLDAGVAALSNIVLSVAVPSSRDLDEMEMAPVVAAVGTIVPGVSFDVIAVSIDGDAEGIYNLKYVRN